MDYVNVHNVGSHECTGDTELDNMSMIRLRRSGEENSDQHNQ